MVCADPSAVTKTRWCRPSTASTTPLGAPSFTLAVTEAKPGAVTSSRSVSAADIWLPEKRNTPVGPLSVLSRAALLPFRNRSTRVPATACPPGSFTTPYTSSANAVVESNPAQGKSLKNVLDAIVSSIGPPFESEAKLSLGGCSRQVFGHRDSLQAATSRPLKASVLMQLSFPLPLRGSPGF